MKPRKNRSNPNHSPHGKKASPLSPEEFTVCALREELAAAQQELAEPLQAEEFTVCALREELAAAKQEPAEPLQAEEFTVCALREEFAGHEAKDQPVGAQALEPDDFTVAGLREEFAQEEVSSGPAGAEVFVGVGDDLDTQAGLEVQAADVQSAVEEALSSSENGMALDLGTMTAISAVAQPRADAITTGWERAEKAKGPDSSESLQLPPVHQHENGRDALTHRIAVKNHTRVAAVPQYIPSTGPIFLLVLADYPGPGTLLTGTPFWGDGPISRMVATALHRNECCDDFTLAMAQLPAVELTHSTARPNFRHVAITYIHSELLEGGVCSIEEVVAKKNLDRLRNVLEAAVSRCPGRLHAVTFGSIAKFVLRGLLYGNTWDVAMTSLQSPSIGVGSERFDELGWIDWATVAMQTEYSLG